MIHLITLDSAESFGKITFVIENITMIYKDKWYDVRVRSSDGTSCIVKQSPEEIIQRINMIMYNKDGK
jgi:uncharacterized protein YlzI (FlbEa/FlbD family)